MSENIKSIADLLPEGLSEESVGEIAALVDSVIAEEVEGRIRTLDAKVSAYLRYHIDEVKEHALRELEEESEVFRNSRLFEELRTFMSIELSQDDEESVVRGAVAEKEQTEEELAVLAEELNKSLVDNEKLENSVKVLSDRNSILEETLGEKDKEIVSLEEEKDEPFKSSEKALVIAENMAQSKRTAPSELNEFLTEDMLKYMP